MLALCHLPLLATVGFPQDPAPAPVHTGVALGDTGLTMVLPEGCAVRDGKALAVRFFAVRPAGEATFLTCNVTDGPAQPPDADGRAVVLAELVAQLPKVLTNYELIEDGTRKVLGKEALWLSGRFETPQGRLRNLQVLVPCAPAFWLTFTMHDADFTAVEKECSAALATLARTGSPTPLQRAAVRRDGARLHVDELRFSFEPPAGWQESDPAAAMGAFLLATGPAAGGFAPNVNVRTDRGMDRVDVAAHGKTARTELPKVLTDCKVEEVEAVKLGKRDCLRMRATYRMGGNDLAIVQYLVPAQPTSFVVTYTLLRAKASAALPAVEKSAASIVVRGAAEDPHEGKKKDG